MTEDHFQIYFEGTGGRGRVGGGPGHGGRFCVDMLDSLLMMAIGLDFEGFDINRVVVDIKLIGCSGKAEAGGSM